MAGMEDIVNRQKEGAQFVLSGAMLRLAPDEFDIVARLWISDGGNGFRVVGVPHRRCIDGEFFIDRLTVVKDSTLLR
ncbi:MAG: hypothetical protein JWP38_3189 [Herbaspirillum sp.]|jgi:hypothetical protein|nr:hypothetical protein [Herbaspirillum sp.]